MLGEGTLEFLAFAEGRFLTVHPFADFNGRTVRLFLAELLRRLDLPVGVIVSPVVTSHRREANRFTLIHGFGMTWPKSYDGHSTHALLRFKFATGGLISRSGIILEPQEATEGNGVLWFTEDI